jgi:CelD/BcsL family acetyltransferase involved in cellulose biosynthesis
MSPDPSIPRELALPDDLVTFRLGRRVLRRDVGRHCDFAAGLLAGTECLSTRRLEAFSGVAEGLCGDEARRATRAVVADLAERPASLATQQDHRRVQVFAEA